ncbi:hypothetical protein DJ548_22555 [Klebsiella grimontii]|nr:hypothetical protein [Klebsiella sp. CVUAS 5466.2]PLL60699.1 hypothetical protein CWN04_02170 [Klebsiella michiganensis]TCZ58396.1 hypothetical protein E0D83_18335 [Klebsiella grimontii]TYG03179.1 hypothetical protein DJ548_22555 [Klebsiella grimontii]
MSEKCDRGHYYVSLPAKIMLQNSPRWNHKSAHFPRTILLQARTIKAGKTPFCKYCQIKVNIRRINGL